MFKKIGYLVLLAGIGLLAGCSTPPVPSGMDAQAPVKFVNEKYHLNVTDLTQVDPAYLFVYANHLYENGQKDDSVFWFYVAQYRGKMIGAMENQNSIVPQQQYQQLAADSGVPVIGKMVVLGRGLNREHLYNFIHSGLGQTINYYAGSNVDNWANQMQRALAFEKEHPFDPFRAVPAEQLDVSKLKDAKKRAEGLSQFISYVKVNKTELERQRAANEQWMKKIEKLKSHL